MRYIAFIFLVTFAIAQKNGIRTLNGALENSQRLTIDTTSSATFRWGLSNGVHTLYLPYRIVNPSGSTFKWNVSGQTAKYDSLRLIAGANVSLTQSGNTVTIATSGGGSVGNADSLGGLPASDWFLRSDTSKFASLYRVNTFHKENLFEPDSGATTQPVIYVRAYDSIGSAGSALDISARKGTSTPMVIHNYSWQARAGLQIDNTVPVGVGSMVGILRLRNANNNTLGDFGREGWKNFLYFSTDSLNETVFYVDPKGAITQGNFQYGTGLFEQVNIVMLPYLHLSTNSRRQTMFRIDSAGNTQPTNLYPLADSVASNGTSGARWLQIHGINQNLRGGLVVGSSTINASDFPLKVYGSDSANSLSATPTGAFSFGNTSTSVSLYAGIYALTSPSYAWFQARKNNDAAWYDIALNPSGGNVVVGNNGTVNTTARFQVKNGLLLSAMNIFNSRNTSILVVDSVGKIGLGTTPAAYLDISHTSTTLDLRLTNSGSNGVRTDYNSTLSGQVKNFRVGTNFISNLKEFVIYDVTNSRHNIYVKDDGAMGFNNVIPSGSGITSKNGLFANARVYTNSRSQTINSIDSIGAHRVVGGVTSAGQFGTAVIVDTVTYTAVGSSIASKNLTSTVGMYRLTYNIFCTTAGSAGTAQMTLSFNNGAAQTMTSASINLTSTTSKDDNVFTYYVASGTPTVSVTVAGATGSPVYSFHAIVERLK